MSLKLLYAIFLLSTVQKKIILRRKHTFQGSGQLVNFKIKCMIIWVTKAASGEMWSWYHGQYTCKEDTLNGVIQLRLALPQHSLPSFLESTAWVQDTTQHSLAFIGSGQWCIHWQAPTAMLSSSWKKCDSFPSLLWWFSVNLELSRQWVCRQEYIINNTEYKIIT